MATPSIRHLGEDALALVADSENTAVDPAAVVPELLRLLPSRQVGVGNLHGGAAGRKEDNELRARH